MNTVRRYAICLVYCQLFFIVQFGNVLGHVAIKFSSFLANSGNMVETSTE